MKSHSFHPDAYLEFQESVNYYFAEASSVISQGFADTVKSAILDICKAPTRWRIVESPGIRRRVLRKFPFVIYYRLEEAGEQVTIYAVMHCSRRPGYWKYRLP